MNEEKRIPFNLKILDTCLPDYFQGFSGPVISFSVDASMTYAELTTRLIEDDAWPASASLEDIRSAVTDLVGQVHLADSRPFYNIGPDSPPSTHFVSKHPTLNDMWLVIDKEDGEVMSSWPTKIEANIAAWDELNDESPPEVYAYFGIELEVPEWYLVDTQGKGKRWTWLKSDGTKVVHGFYTEIEARIAAWKHKLAEDDFRGPAENHEQLLDGINEMLKRGRLTESDIPEDYHWLVESLAHLAAK